MISNFPFLLGLDGGTACTIDLFGPFWDISLWDSDRDKGEKNSDSGNAIFRRLVQLLRKLARQQADQEFFDALPKIIAHMYGEEEDENKVVAFIERYGGFLSSLRSIETDAFEREFWNCEYSMTGLINVWRAVGPEVDVLKEDLSQKNKEELVSFLVVKRVPLIFFADMDGSTRFESNKILGSIDQTALRFLATYVISPEKDCHAELSSLEKRREVFRLQDEEKVLQHSLLLFITTL